MNTNHNQFLQSKLDSLMSQLMTTEEASLIWDLSADRIKALCASGAITAAKKGNTWLILRDQDNPKQRQR